MMKNKTAKLWIFLNHKHLTSVNKLQYQRRIINNSKNI